MQGLFITSNNTDAGKTFISCQIIDALNDVLTIEPRKPIETNCQQTNQQLIAKDATLLQKFCKEKYHIDDICPYKFTDFASGEMASSETNITLDDLVKKCQSDNFLIVEGAGGLYSPIIKNNLNSDLAKILNLPIMIIIEDKIGCISEALLTIKSAENENLDICCVILNQKKVNNLNNFAQLKKYTRQKVIQFSYDKKDFFKKSLISVVKEKFENFKNWRL